jgi:glycosyltransferase involved in cell wall biosynthesis
MYVYGGGELLVVRLANYLSRNGIPNTILTTGILPEIIHDLIDTRIINAADDAARYGSLMGTHLGSLAALRKQIKENLEFFDVINVHNYPAELCTFPHVKPVVWMCNEPPEVAVNVRLKDASPFSWKRLAFNTVLTFEKQVVKRYISVAVVADDFNKRRFDRLYGFSPRIANYGIDHDFFSQIPDEINRDENRFTLLHVGMITPLKNQIDSVKALKSLQERIPGVHLVLAGNAEGRYAESLKAYIRDNKLQDYVTFTGHIDRHALRDLFFTSDILLHPVKSQGGWLSPFEALCAKLPIVVSQEMTASSIIKDHQLGRIADDLPEAISLVYEDREKYRKMAERASGWVKNNLSWDRFSEQMLTAFKTAMVEPGKRSLRPGG